MKIWKAIKLFFSAWRKGLLNALIPIIEGKSGDILATVQPLAIKAVENAAHLDLDGDGKRKHAKDEIKKEVKKLEEQGKDVAKDIGKKAVNLAIELALAEFSKKDK